MGVDGRIFPVSSSAAPRRQQEGELGQRVQHPNVARIHGIETMQLLGLPLTSTLLAVMLFSSDGLSVTPLVIVAVVISYVLSAHLPHRLSDLRRKPTTPVDLDLAPAGGS